MKANEFVKKYGIAEAKRVLHDARGCTGVKLWGRCEFSTDELKRLVDSYDFVSTHGSIESARMYCDSQDSARKSKHYNSLRKRISEVESCQ